MGSNGFYLPAPGAVEGKLQAFEKTNHRPTIDTGLCGLSMPLFSQEKEEDSRDKHYSPTNHPFPPDGLGGCPCAQDDHQSQHGFLEFAHGYGVGLGTAGPAVSPRFLAVAPMTERVMVSEISSTPSPKSASAFTRITVSPGSSELTRRAERPSSATTTWLLPEMTDQEGAPSRTAGLPVSVFGARVTGISCSLVILSSRGIDVISFGVGWPTVNLNPEACWLDGHLLETLCKIIRRTSRI